MEPFTQEVGPVQPLPPHCPYRAADPPEGGGGPGGWWWGGPGGWWWGGPGVGPGLDPQHTFQQ